MWLLRDFMLELADEDGNPQSPSEYLEWCLKDQEGFSQKIAEKNRIRGLIKQFFKVGLSLSSPRSDWCRVATLLLHPDPPHG